MFVQRDHNLTITSSLELVAGLRDQLLSDPLMIIKFSVDYGMHSILGVVERLRAVRAQIVDGQPVVAESCGASLVHS